MTTWLKECEICNEGLCKEMSYLTDSVEKGGVGLSVREAAKRLEGHAVEQVGEKIWTAEQIRARYLYHTGQVKSPNRVCIKITQVIGAGALETKATPANSQTSAKMKLARARDASDNRIVLGLIRLNFF